MNARLIALAAVLLSGCGEDPRPDAVKHPSRPEKIDSERFLLRDGEEPGFKRVDAPHSEMGVEAFVNGGDMPDDAAKRLRRAGFVSFTFQRVVVEGGNAGVTNVHVFETEKGARDWMEWETSDAGIHEQVPDTKIRRFTVSGIPRSRGWVGTDLHGNRIGNLSWVQGRCMLGIANEGEGDFVKPLSKGAKAIYARTRGACP